MLEESSSKKTTQRDDLYFFSPPRGKQSQGTPESVRKAVNDGLQSGPKRVVLKDRQSKATRIEKISRDNYMKTTEAYRQLHKSD